MVYITLIDYYIHAKSQMILLFFYIYKTWKETKNVVINIQEIRQTIQFTISVVQIFHNAEIMNEFQ